MESSDILRGRQFININLYLVCHWFSKSTHGSTLYQLFKCLKQSSPHSPISLIQLYFIGASFIIVYISFILCKILVSLNYYATHIKSVINRGPVKAIKTTSQSSLDKTRQKRAVSLLKSPLLIEKQRLKAKLLSYLNKLEYCFKFSYFS